MKLVKLLCASLMLGCLQAKAADDIGVGAILGSPTGVSAHIRMDDRHLLAGALAYNFSRYPGLHISVDYLWDNAYEYNIKSWQWDVYYGLGGRVIGIQSGDDKNKTAVGVRAPVAGVARGGPLCPSLHRAGPQFQSVGRVGGVACREPTRHH